MRILTISHSFPSKERPHVTPFIHSFCKALAGQPEVELHLLTPNVDQLELPNVAVHHFEALGGHIAHKDIGDDHASVS